MAIIDAGSNPDERSNPTDYFGNEGKAASRTRQKPDNIVQNPRSEDKCAQTQGDFFDSLEHWFPPMCREIVSGRQ